MKQPLRIGLYGGSFNPVHCGHVMVAHWALMTGNYDKLYIVPTFKHNFGKELLGFEYRYQMTKAAFEHLNGFVEVSPVEQQIGNSVTANTVEYLTETLGRLGYEPKFTILVGTDVADQIDKWTGIERLRALADFSIIDRSIYAQGISSTKIRKSLVGANGYSPMSHGNQYLRQTLPQKVLSMIANNGWYGWDDDWCDSTRTQP